MRKILLPLLSVVLMTACQKESTTSKPEEEIASVAAKGSSKILVCHYDVSKGNWKTMSINPSALPDHQAHGDVRLDDPDGDGYVPTNNCGYGQMGDCDDNNAAVNPGATEICGNGIDDNCNGQTDENCQVTLEIGDEYQGGLVAYILQPGDPGYDANVQHGLISAVSNLGLAYWGCDGVLIAGADGTAIGTGNQNTIDIVAGCTTAGIAARLCSDLDLNGYSDWYLPSIGELGKLYINRVQLGLNALVYVSSTEASASTAAGIYFQIGPDPASFNKGLNAALGQAVQPVRSF